VRNLKKHLRTYCEHIECVPNGRKHSWTPRAILHLVVILPHPRRGESTRPGRRLIGLSVLLRCALLLAARETNGASTATASNECGCSFPWPWTDGTTVPAQITYSSYLSVGAHELLPRGEDRLGRCPFLGSLVSTSDSMFRFQHNAGLPPSPPLPSVLLRRGKASCKPEVTRRGNGDGKVAL